MCTLSHHSLPSHSPIIPFSVCLYNSNNLYSPLNTNNIDEISMTVDRNIHPPTLPSELLTPASPFNHIKTTHSSVRPNPFKLSSSPLASQCSHSENKLMHAQVQQCRTNIVTLTLFNTKFQNRFGPKHVTLSISAPVLNMNRQHNVNKYKGTTSTTR